MKIIYFKRNSSLGEQISEGKQQRNSCRVGFETSLTSWVKIVLKMDYIPWSNRRKMTAAVVSRRHPCAMAVSHTLLPTRPRGGSLPVPPALATGAPLCLLTEPGRRRTRGNALDFSLFSLGRSQVWLMGDLFFLMFNLAVPPFLPLLVPESTV